MEVTLRFIVVSGLPASGKSTVGRRVGAALQMPVFDKDDFLEARFGDEPVSAGERSRLSRLADEDLQATVRAATSGVIVSFWRRPELSTTSGTPTEWLVDLPDVAEVRCVCDPAIARDRFVARRRHAGHGDSQKDPAEVLAGFQRLHALGPLGLWRVVEVRTDTPIDIAEVVQRLSAG